MKALWKNELAVAALLILVLASIGYGFLWQGGEILYSPHSDIIAEHLGTKTILYKALREGHGIPFWREDQFSGYPAFTNPQAFTPAGIRDGVLSLMDENSRFVAPMLH